MASITTKKRSDGSIAYRAFIVRRNPKYQESRTFDSHKTAKSWAKAREREIDAEIAEGKTLVKKPDRKTTVGDAIDKYLNESMRQIGETKTQVLKTIRNEYAIARMPCANVTSQDLVQFVQQLYDRPDLNSPSTALNYLSHLSGVFAIARPMWGFQLDYQQMKDAQKVCSTMGFTGKSNSRDRRPSLDEADKLMTHFYRSWQAEKRLAPMHVIMAFAIFSTRRQAEICRIKWSDYDKEGQRVLVRKMKNPGDKGGIDTWVELPEQACRIIDAVQRKKGEYRIFPYHSNTLSARFTKACKVLEIVDLRFHDLRHEGASRLAEMGRTIPLIASVTGHRSWQSLEGYTHVRARGDKYENWKWLDKVT